MQRMLNPVQVLKLDLHVIDAMRHRGKSLSGAQAAGVCEVWVQILNTALCESSTNYICISKAGLQFCACVGITTDVHLQSSVCSSDFCVAALVDSNVIQLQVDHNEQNVCHNANGKSKNLGLFGLISLRTVSVSDPVLQTLLCLRRVSLSSPGRVGQGLVMVPRTMRSAKCSPSSRPEK